MVRQLQQPTLPLAAALVGLLLLFLQPAHLQICPDPDTYVGNVTCRSIGDSGPSGPCAAPCAALGAQYKKACCAQMGSSGPYLCVCCQVACTSTCLDPPLPSDDPESDTDCVLVNYWSNDCGDDGYYAGGICIDGDVSGDPQ